MAVYSFVCKECGETKTVEWTVSEYDERKNNVLCPRCGSIMQRKFAAPQFIDKTGDFYSSSNKKG